MKVRIKTAEQIGKMRTAGRLAAEVLQMIGTHVRPGVSTAELDRLCHRFIVDHQQAVPANIGYGGGPRRMPFPAATCCSINNVVCHGIPCERELLQDGDILNIDVTVIKDGWHGDSSRMFLVGNPSDEAKRLVQISREAMYCGIRSVRPGATLGDVGNAIQCHALRNGFSVVREYCGHGIGRVYHEPPEVLNYGEPGQGLVLQPGMVFTIEPMLNAGSDRCRQLADGWTVVTEDGAWSAQWEHTVAVTEQGVELLTVCEGDDNLAWLRKRR